MHKIFTIFCFVFLLAIFDKTSAQCTVSVSASANPVCSGTAVLLFASGATTYVWSSGLGTSNPVTVAPTVTTTYTVTGTSFFCTSTASITIIVVPTPTVSITASVNPVCTGSFTVLTANGASNYIWSGGLGTSNPLMVSPTTNTTYTVIGTNAFGCTNTSNIFIFVVSNPVANFVFTPNNFCSSAPIAFTNTSTGFGLTYYWNFGDPSSGVLDTSTFANPIHTFSSATGIGIQSFFVTLTVTNSFGCSNSITQIVTVKQSPDASIADFISAIPFTHCGGTSFDLVVTNISTTASTNTNYVINWGDGTSNFSSTIWAFNDTVSHEYYTQGYDTINITVTGTNGCVSTNKYIVYNGSNPAISFPNPGGTVGKCVPDTLTINITNTAMNPPGTIYIVTTNAGTPADTFYQPPPPTYTYIFTTSSCGATGAITPNCFFIHIRAQNPCGFSEQTVNPITTGVKPSAGITISPDTIDCINTTVTFTNTNINGSVVDAFGNCTTTTFSNWTITPVTGWAVVSGLLGSPNPTSNPSTWGSSTLGVSFSIPGQYFISMIAKNNCGGDTLTKKICVESPPVPLFNINPSTGCLPVNVTTTNLSNTPYSCTVTTYLWSVSYTATNCGTSPLWSYTHGTDSVSFEPSFVFNNPGTYTITLAATNECGTFNTNETVVVKKPPTDSILPISNSCGPLTVTPIANVVNCGSNSLIYAWTFGGGTPATSTSANPGTISFSSNGIHVISLSVTNECGTTSSNVSFNIFPQPVANAGTNVSICLGQSTTLAGSVSNGLSPYTYSWNSAPAGFNSNLQNPVVNPTVNTTYILNITDANLCTASNQVMVSVNPLPLVAVNSSTICVGQSATLTASGANTYLWSTGSITNTIVVSPTTTTIYSVAGSIIATGCDNTAASTVTVNPLPIVNAGPSIMACNQPVPVTLTGYSPAGGTWSGSGVTSSGIFTPISIGNFILTYSYTDPFTSCSNQDTMIVSVVNPQVANAGNGFSCCVNASPITLTGYSPGGGTWIGTGITGNIFDPATAGIGNFVLTYSYGASSCLSTDTIQVTVSPIPTVTVNSPTICSGQSVTLTANGANTYIWSNTATTNSIIVNPTISTAYTITGTNILGCSAFATSSVTVNPLPVVDAGLSFTACDQPIPITLSGYSPLGGTWSGTGVTSSGIFIPTTIGNFILTYSYTDPITGCSNQDTLTASVVNFQVVDAGNGFSCCLNAPHVNLTGFSPAGGTWTGVGITGTTFNPATAGPGNFVLTYSYGALTCLNTDTINVIVYPEPNVTTASPTTICSGTSTNIALNSSVAGTTFSWTIGAITGGITGAIAGNGPTIAQTLINSGSTTGTVTYIVTPIANNCPGLATNIIVTVNPLPVITSMDTTICSGIGFMVTPVDVTNGTVPSGTTYSWAAPVVTGGITGGTAGSGSVNINGILFNPTNIVQIATYTVTPTSGGCPGVVFTVTVNVNPAPNVTTASPTSICSGTSTNIALNSNVGGTTFSWTIGAIIGGIIGATPSIGSTIAQTLFDPGTAAGTVTYIVTPSSNACPGIPTNIVVTVDVAADITIIDSSVCSGNVFTITPVNITNGIVPPGTTYSWAAPIVTGGLTGGTAGVGSPNISGMLTNPTNTAQLATYTVTPTSGSCIGLPFSIIITVNPIPDITTASPTTICSGSTTNIALTSNVAGTTFSWTIGAITGGITGASASSGLIIAQTLTNPGITAGTVTFIVTPSANSCPGIASNIIVTVNPEPNVSTISPTTICSETTTNIALTSTVAGTTFSWTIGTIIGPVTGATPSNGSTIAQTLINTGDTIGTVTYIVTPSANSCPGNPTNIVVTVNPKPIVSFGISVNYGCTPTVLQLIDTVSGLADSVVFNFGDGSPNQTFIHFNNILNHSYSYFGTWDTTYIITLIGYNNCGTDTMQRSVIIYPNTVHAFFNTDTLSGCPPLTVNFTNYSTGGTSFFWNFGDGNVTNVANPTHAYILPGQYVAWLIVTNGCNYDTAYSDTINVFPVASPSFSFSNNICARTSMNFINNTPGMISYSWDFGDGSPVSILTNPSHIYANPDTYQVTLTVINLHGCSSSVTIPVNVKFTPTPTFATTANTGCSPLTVQFLNMTDSLNFNNYLWSFSNGVTSILINPPNQTFINQSHCFDTTYHISLVADNAGCFDTSYLSVLVHPLPLSNFITSDSLYCRFDPPANIQFFEEATCALAYQWFVGNALVSDSNNTFISFPNSGFYNISLVVSNQFSCTDTVTKRYIVYPKWEDSIRLSPTSGCVPLGVSFQSTVDSLSYHWSFGDNTTSNMINNYHLYQNQGLYTVQVNVTGTGGCKDSLVLFDTIKVFPRATASFTYQNIDNPPPDNGSVLFTNTSQNAISYIWNFGDGTMYYGFDTLHRYLYNDNFEVILIANDAFNCPDTATEIINLDMFHGLFIPNAFSPTSTDPLVQNFQPIGVGIKAYRIQVYDTWGNIIWESTALDAEGKPAEYWDGKSNGVQLPMDSYVWKASAVFNDGSIWQGMNYGKGKPRTYGTVTIIK